MSKKARARKGKKARGKKQRNQALTRALAIAGSIVGVLAVGAGGVLARGALKQASWDLGRSIESGLARVRHAWPFLDASNGVPTARGLS